MAKPRIVKTKPARAAKGTGMNRLMYVIFAILVAFVGCWLSVQFLPPGIPTTLGEVFSVIAGFGMFFGGPRWFHD